MGSASPAFSSGIRVRARRDDGRFTLQNCTPELVFALSMRRGSVFPKVQLEHLKAGGEERVIRLPKEASAPIRGRILDPEGKVLPNVYVSPFRSRALFSPAETTDVTGAFDPGHHGRAWSDRPCKWAVGANRISNRQELACC
ncbi:MAG: hypothetical protein AB1486_32605 [Planctomycetota bacterium]